MTEIIVRPRRGGKTTEILKRLEADPSAVMIVGSLREAVWAERAAQAQGITIQKSQLVTLRAAMSGERMQGLPPTVARHALVDNVDLLLQELLHMRVTVMTATATVEPEPCPRARPDHDVVGDIRRARNQVEKTYAELLMRRTVEEYDLNE